MGLPDTALASGNVSPFQAETGRLRETDSMEPIMIAMAAVPHYTPARAWWRK